MARIRVLLDACVLLPYQLADLLLRLADAEMYEPLWSEDILAEVERNLITTFDVPPEKAARRLNHMRAAFPNAVVDGYHHLVAAMTNDPKDRHVAAAAVRGHAALIVTANLRDFPPNTLEHYDIEAVHPDKFLQDQLDLAPATTLACVQEHRAAYTRPQFTYTEYYLGLTRTVPNFARLAAAAEQSSWQSDTPLPLAIAPEDQVLQAFFPDGEPDPFNPLGAASLWWTALLNKPKFLVALHNLTWHPPAWGNFDEALDRLSNAGMMQFVERCPDDNTIAYVKFMPNVDHTMQAFGEAPVEHVQVLTMVRCEDGFWRAWGVCENRFPTSAEVKGQ